MSNQVTATYLGLNHQQRAAYAVVVRYAAGCKASCAISVIAIPHDDESDESEGDVTVIVRHGDEWFKIGAQFHQGLDLDLIHSLQAAARGFAHPEVSERVQMVIYPPFKGHPDHRIAMEDPLGQVCSTECEEAAKQAGVEPEQVWEI